MNKQFRRQSELVIILLAVIGLAVTACGSSTERETSLPPELRTRLLVKAPKQALPVKGSIEVISRTQDPDNQISHVELYMVQWPSKGEGNEATLLVRSNVAPFEQKSFTVSQTFAPTQNGHYVLKVVGYNIKGKSAESNYLGFDVQ